MRFDKIALIAVAFLAANNFSSNESNCLALAEEAPEVVEAAPYTPPEGSESFEFEAEVSRMLDIVINSLYTNKEVFLRELISNASDALDKIRFMAIKKPELMDEKEELEIKIEFDPEQKTFTIRDTGCGMTKDDMIKNLGTVARSGTSKFVEAMQEGKQADLNMIGQFGVGFYSSFLVADRVRVTSKHPDDPNQYIWESENGASAFHIAEDPNGNTLGRGTEVTLFLKDEAQVDYLDQGNLNRIVSHYSEFVTHPIFLRNIEVTQVPVETPESEDAAEEGEDMEISEDDDEDPTEPEMEEVTTYTWQHVNTNQPIWTRSKDEITDDEYQAFYEVVSKNDMKNATTWTHFDAEGNINFKSLLYLPSEVPQSLLQGIIPENQGLNLYVRKVLISDAFDLLPRYLSFVKGVVDSADLPLNVNRETLQENNIIKVIKKKLTKKAIEMITKLSKKEAEPVEEEVELDEDGNVVEKDELDVEEKPVPLTPYEIWYEQFSPSIKLGCMEDEPNRGKLMKLLRFKTSKFTDDRDYVTLDQYVERMKEWQKDIYYFAGSSIKELDYSQFMDKFKTKDVEVLYLTGPMDEYMMNSVRDYSGKSFVSITKENIKFGDEDADFLKRLNKAYKAKFKDLTTQLSKIYGGSVDRVTISNRLESAAAMISHASWSHSANMERLMQAQAFNHGQNAAQARASRVLELNPRHPLVVKLDNLLINEMSQDTEDMAWVLLDIALLNSGFPLSEQKGFGKRMTRILQALMDVESLELEDEIEVPEEDEQADDFGNDMPEGLNMEDFDMSQFEGMEGFNMEDLDNM